LCLLRDAIPVPYYATLGSQSVCPSVTLRYPDHICWNTSKFFTAD